jgi:DNA repair ATPase RecN
MSTFPQKNFGRKANSEYDRTMDVLAERITVNSEIEVAERELSGIQGNYNRLRHKQPVLRSTIDGLQPYADKKNAEQQQYRLREAKGELQRNVEAVDTLAKKDAALRDRIDHLTKRLQEINALPVSLNVLRIHQAKIVETRGQLENIDHLIGANDNRNSAQFKDDEELRRLKILREDCLANVALGESDKASIAKIDKDIDDICSRLQNALGAVEDVSQSTAGLKRRKDKLSTELHRLEEMHPLLKQLFLRQKISDLAEVYDLHASKIIAVCHRIAALEALMWEETGDEQPASQKLPIWQISLPLDITSRNGNATAFSLKEIIASKDEAIAAELEAMEKVGIELF